MFIKLLTLIFLANFHQVTSQTVTFTTVAAMDTTLCSILTGLKSEETNIRSLLSSTISLVQTTADLYRSNAKVVSLVSALDSFNTYLKNFLTINSYDSCSTTVTCDDINAKITELNFDQLKLNAIWKSSLSNTSVIYQQGYSVNTEFSFHFWRGNVLFNSIGYTNLNTISTQITRILLAYNSYNVKLIQAYNIDYFYSVNLYVYKNSICTCPENIPVEFLKNVSMFLDNMNNLEQPLIANQTSVRSLAQKSLLTVTETLINFVGVSSFSGVSLTIILNNLKTILAVPLSTLDDYPPTSSNWTNTTNCSAISEQSSFITYKIYQCNVISVKIATYTNLVATYQVQLNNSIITSQLTSNQLSSVQRTINSLIVLVMEMRTYLNGLIFSVWKLRTIYVDVNLLRNTYCVCVNTVTCGERAKMNMSNVQELKTLGFYSGTFYDGGDLYPGTFDATLCFNQNPCPTSISTGPTPGAYSICGFRSFFDNETVEYVKYHPNLRWRPASASNYSSIPGIFAVVSPYAPMYYGRLNFTSGVQVIGKIYNGDLYYRTQSNSEATSSVYEILTCT